jgi:hypothetical protein
VIPTRMNLLVGGTGTVLHIVWRGTVHHVHTRSADLQVSFTDAMPVPSRTVRKSSSLIYSCRYYRLWAPGRLSMLSSFGATIHDELFSWREGRFYIKNTRDPTTKISQAPSHIFSVVIGDFQSNWNQNTNSARH